MTNRRKGSKARASLSKKSDTPEKQLRKLNRRSRRSRKSVSPEEQPEEVVSEYSVDENIDDDGRGTCDHERDNNGSQRPNDEYETVSKLGDEQKSQLKEEESGGSDGSWKVKSENGGSGGIPKLKLCLTRPPEMSSPTAEQPSPRRRRRGRGIASPAKDEQLQIHEELTPEEKQSPKRSTRSQKAKELLMEPEIPVQAKIVEALEAVETVRSEACDSTNLNHSEDETQIAVDSIIDVQKQDEATEEVTEEYHAEVETKEIFNVETNTIPEAHERIENKKDTKKENEEIAHIQLGVIESGTNNEGETRKEDEEKRGIINSQEPKLNESKEEMWLERGTFSRDSSEERAKEAALMSRNKNKFEVLEEGEVVETSREDESGRRAEGAESQSSMSDEKNIIKESQESVPAKANNRKRRWGASISRVTKKPQVSISTDFLKEIIPEIKVLPMSEVELSPNDEEEEGQVKESEENLQITTKVDKDKIVESDESEKDYEEDVIESVAEESPKNECVKATQVKEKAEFPTFTRKVSVLPSNDINKLPRSPSPPRYKPSNILYIVNLVRPFTIPQLRELLARTGTISKDGFWIDKIKSRCYVKYETEEEAKTTRHALHGVRWPVSNPKQLNVDFGTEAAMKAAQEGNEILPKRPIPSLFDKPIDLKNSEKTKERDQSRERKEKNEKEKKEIRPKHREEEDKEKKTRPLVEPLVRDRTVRRVTVPVREWDVGKNEDGFSPPTDGMDFGRYRDDRYDRKVEYDRDKRDEFDERRRREKNRGRRSISNEPPHKSRKKKEEEAPSKLLDDLFRKTKTTPCIYWLPLSSEQIAVKEELRRKHMAEHEKRVAELRKIQREQNKRSSDKRRRRSKSHSRSRSQKK